MIGPPCATLRIPTNRNEITPELIGDLMANLRKLCNLTVNGTALTELPNGFAATMPSQLQIKLFQIVPGTSGSGGEQNTGWSYDLTQIPGNSDGSRSKYYPQKCAFAQAKEVRYLHVPGGGSGSGGGDGGTNEWTDGTSTYNPPAEIIWHPSGYQLGDNDCDRTFPAALQGGDGDDDGGSGSGDKEKWFYPITGVGEWVWCIQDPDTGFWLVLQPFEDIVDIELKGDLTPGGSAAAFLMLPDGSDANVNLTTITVYDSPEACRRALGRTTMGGGDDEAMRAIAPRPLDKPYRNKIMGTTPIIFHANGLTHGSPHGQYHEILAWCQKQPAAPCAEVEVVTWNSRPQPYPLEGLLKQNGQNHVVLGRGVTPWRNPAKLGLTLAHIQQSQARYVMGMDGANVCYYGDLSRAIALLTASGKGLIFNGEQSHTRIGSEMLCWPKRTPVELGRYQNRQSRSPWRFLNSGVWIAEREYAIEVFRKAKALDDRMGGDSDQFFFHHLFPNEPRMGIDYECRVFQCGGLGANILE